MADRPQDFRIDYGHPLAKGLVFAGLGRHANSTHYHDSSLYGNHGTLIYVDVPATATAGWVWDSFLRRWATHFNGSFGYVSASPKCASGLTQVVWCNLHATGSYPAMFTLDAYAADLRFYASGTTAQYENISGSAVSLNTWHCYAGTAAPVTKTGTLYQDGRFQNSGTVTSDHTTGIYLGKRSDGNYMNGLVSDPLLFNRVLSSSEISVLADPSNTMLSGLILPPKRRLFIVSVAGGTTFKPAWAIKRQKTINIGVM